MSNESAASLIESINEIISNRRSIYPRDFIAKEIPRDIIENLLRNADRAPTHKLTQPWRFRVLRKESKMELGKFLAKKYREVYEGTERFKESKVPGFTLKTEQADCIIAIHMQRDPKESIPEWEEIASVAMAVQNMWLTASAYNIGAYWSSPSFIKYMPEFYDMAEGEKCLGFFYMGYHERVPPLSRRKSLNEKVTWLD